MGKFNVHGGIFAPKGYFRVNEGGSHETNPNGGVQVGVDEEGVPNLLEEDEPVYNDFVYSDRITADPAVLEEFNIPSKYAGKLYSEIADSYVDEAEQRPNDPISNNGLNAMLVRVANAQEEQKRREEQAQIEQELSQMSPEELAQLEQILADEEAVSPEEEVMMQEPIDVSPEFACGGKVHKFGNGSPETDNQTRAAQVMAAARQAQLAQENAVTVLNNEEEQRKKREEELKALNRQIKRYTRHVERDEKITKRMEEHALKVHPTDAAAYQSSLIKQYGVADYNKKRLQDARYKLMAIQSLQEPEINFDDNPPAASKSGKKPVSETDARFGWLDELAAKNGYKARGGKMNMFALGSPYKPNYKIDLLHPETTPRNGSQALASKMDLRNPAPAKKIPELLWNRSSNRSTANKPSVGDTPGSTVPTTSPEVAPESTTLPTWPMYAGVIGNGLTALYNAFQPVDKYSFRTLQAQEPEGRMRQQYMKYNPIPFTLLQNKMAAQNAGNVRAALASGYGTSLPSLLVAMDKNYTDSQGDALLKLQQANNEAYNAVVAGNNAADARQAQFDAQIDEAKKRARAEVDRVNQMYDMREQMMNNEAEQAKYNAVQTSIDNLLAGLSGIGRQNFAINQVNTNPYLLYGVRPNGVGYFKSCGGSLIKRYKK